MQCSVDRFEIVLILLQLMKEEHQKRNIRLHIYDTFIPVKVPQEEEPLYRKDADLINERLNTYFANFKDKISDKEIIFYAMIDIGLRLQKELQRNDTRPYDDSIQELTKEIEDLLGEGESAKE